MSRITKLLFIVTLTITSLYAANKVSKAEIESMQKLPLFTMAQVQVNSAIDAGSFYVLNVTVRGKTDKIFLTKDKKYIVPGDAISTENGQPLEVPVDLAPTLGKEAFTFGKGKDEYVLFTDPECPYCKKFESYFHEIEDKVKIRVFFFPLDFHPNAKDISVFIMSQDSYEGKVKTMTTTTKDSEDFKNRKYKAGQEEKLQAKLAEQMSIGSQLGVRGTPSLFDKNGNKISWAGMLQGYGVVVK